MFFVNVKYERKQSESGWRAWLPVALVLAVALPAAAQTALNSGGSTFRDFGVADNGASFGRKEVAAPEGKTARLISVDAAAGKALVAFDTIKVVAAVPTGWQTGEDAERGVAYNADRSYRLLFWRVDFAFEGVKNAEHYASEKAGAIQARRPGVKSRAQPLGDGSFLITYENVAAGNGDREPRTVYDVIMPMPGDPKKGILMTLGVPVSQAAQGLRLMALLKQEIKVTP